MTDTILKDLLAETEAQLETLIAQRDRLAYAKVELLNSLGHLAVLRVRNLEDIEHTQRYVASIRKAIGDQT